MAIRAATQMRDLAVRGEAPWARIFGSAIVITSSSDWPEPDFVFSDPSSKTAFGFEFKPPGQVRREYLTGLGQTLSYLKRFEQALLIVPEEAEGLKIATYIEELTDGLPLPIGIVSYDRDDIGNLRLIHAPPAQPVGPLQGKASLRDTFWAFWMDQSINEFYLMLRTAYQMRTRKGDIRERVFTKVFYLMKNGKTYANDGNPRKLGATLKFSSWFLNYRLSYEHCELWGADGKLTLRGVRLYQIAETYGWDSEQFRSAIAKAFLEMGRHLVLMKYIWDIQMELIDQKIVHNSTKNYLNLMRDKLVARGFGKPRGVLKEISKMMSLWGGGFRILNRFGRGYYLQGFGLVPNWPKVSEIMTSQIW
jgi:hypothetical protein